MEEWVSRWRGGWVNGGVGKWIDRWMGGVGG